MSNKADRDWIVLTFADAFTPKEHYSVDEWVDKVDFMLPSNTSEPGKYSVDRTPYQREILKVFSPDHPAKTIVLVFGSQMGKTTVENIVMCYYIQESPSPIAFAFSDDGNLKNYVKNKFDPMLSANPWIKELLRSEGRSSGDTVNLKIFPGGFLKFLSGRSEASMRSDSIRLVMADEVDAMKLAEGGDIKDLLAKRQNTFKETSKMGLSSTPSNESTIYQYLQESTYRKYYVPCPHCGEMFTLELDTLKWRTKEGTNVVSDAWMECPHCKGRINNEDKLDMCMKGEWRSTNPNADPTYEGFKLPSFYAPVGWISWKDIAQEWVTAFTSTDEKREERLTTFYNTILAEPYQAGSNSQEWRVHFDKAQSSPYTRGKIPRWVNVLTTGADIQGNRIEISLYGWGRLGRSLAIDHWEILTSKEELDTMGSDVWVNYFETVLHATFEREDGLIMQTMANGIDSSYMTNAVMTFWLSLPPEFRARLYCFRGRDSLDGYRPNRQFYKGANATGAEWWQVPVSNLKRTLFGHLEDSLKEVKGDEKPAYYMEFPCDYTQEYYQQLFSEAWVKDKKKWVWKKIRDRNEILDITVYNLCLFYALGCGDWSAENWDAFAEQQKVQASGGFGGFTQKRRRVVSKGVSL